MGHLGSKKPSIALRAFAMFFDLLGLYFVVRVAGLFGQLIAHTLLPFQKIDPQVPEILHSLVQRDSVFLGGEIATIFFGVVYLYLNFGILQGLGGASIGKAICGLSVVDRYGQPIGVWTSLLRTSQAFLFFLPLGLGFFLAYFDSWGRALHDRTMKSRVISVFAEKVAPIEALPAPSTEAVIHAAEKEREEIQTEPKLSNQDGSDAA